MQYKFKCYNLYKYTCEILRDEFDILRWVLSMATYKHFNPWNDKNITNKMAADNAQLRLKTKYTVWNMTASDHTCRARGGSHLFSMTSSCESTTYSQVFHHHEIHAPTVSKTKLQKKSTVSKLIWIHKVYKLKLSIFSLHKKCVYIYIVCVFPVTLSSLNDVTKFKNDCVSKPPTRKKSQLQVQKCMLQNETPPPWNHGPPPFHV